MVTLGPVEPVCSGHLGTVEPVYSGHLGTVCSGHLGTVEPVCSGHHGTSVCGHHRQVAALSRSFCTRLAKFGTSSMTIIEVAALNKQ